MHRPHLWDWLLLFFYWLFRWVWDPTCRIVVVISVKSITLDHYSCCCCCFASIHAYIISFADHIIIRDVDYVAFVISQSRAKDNGRVGCFVFSQLLPYFLSLVFPFWEKSEISISLGNRKRENCKFETKSICLIINWLRWWP